MVVIATEVTPTATSTPTSTVPHVNTTDGISQQVPTATGM